MEMSQRFADDDLAGSPVTMTTTRAGSPVTMTTTRAAPPQHSNIPTVLTKRTIFRCSLCAYYSYFREVTQSHVDEHNILLVSADSYYSNNTCSYPDLPKPRDDIADHLQCTMCLFRASDKSEYTEHRKLHSSKRPYKCSFCEYRGRNRAHVLSHEYCKHTGEKPFRCPYCSFRSAHQSALTIHTRRHTGRRPYRCSYCSWSGIEKSQYTAHLCKHTGERPYPCQECEYTATSRSLLVSHQKTHSSVKPKVCSQCTFRTRTTGKLRSHMKVHHAKYCGFCPFSCKDSTEFRQHTKSHKLKCRFCFKGCPDSSKLREHEAIHTADRKFKCDKCAYNTAKKSLFQKHLGSHVTSNENRTEKDIKCKICLFVADRPSSLGMHMRTHKMDVIPRVDVTQGNHVSVVQRVDVTQGTHVTPVTQRNHVTTVTQGSDQELTENTGISETVLLPAYLNNAAEAE